MPAKCAKIQDYGIIGDCRSAALVSREGSIDWLCWPKFDSPAIFCAILDRERGGYWRIGVLNATSIARKYVPDTNVLLTTFHCASGTVTLTDLMPVSSEAFKRTTRLPDQEIVRQIECSAGEAEIEMEFVPRALYGLHPISVHDLGKLGIRAKVGKGVYWLRTNAPLDLSETLAQSRFRIRAGDTFQFSFSYTEEAPAVLNPLGDFVRAGIERSINFWREWAGRATYEGPYREAVVRSVLALKLLTFAPSGAIIASPTTSLPERIGGSLNWDYRYCWLRDASLTIRGLLGLGYWDEASDFMEWMLHTTWLTQPELQTVYTLYGRPALEERELKHLSGFKNSSPVRIGNLARDQLQLDIYGEVIDAAAQYVFRGGTLDAGMQKALRNFGKYVVKHWSLPDEGIWEPRSGRSKHTHSRLLCWTAMDRLLNLRDHGWKLTDAHSFSETRQQIEQEIRSLAWNPALQSYTSVLGGDQMDASLLLFAWYGFEKSDNLRMQTTYARIRDQLDAGNGLLYRYRNDHSEGAFALCSFWEVEFLALGGGTQQAAENLFHHLLSFQNELGLYAEEIDPANGNALGNFPQAFTHVGVIGAALSIADRAKGTQSLPHRQEKASSHGTAQEASA
jgi:GH15 family glucan-1,4-alpha-glucosidase